MTDDLRARVEDALRTKVAPALDLDGSGISVLEVDRGCAVVRLNGVCAGCPGNLMALVPFIETELRKHVPEVEYLEVAP